jgi:hypothetical protein
MKYTRMLCWVRPQDRKELEAVAKDIPLEFVNSLSEFESKITKDSYLIVSLGYINYNFKKFADKFPDNTFNLYGVKAHEKQTIQQTLTMGYNNITNGQYDAEELRKNYLGIIKDLWQYRLFENPTVICFTNKNDSDELKEYNK